MQGHQEDRTRQHADEVQVLVTRKGLDKADELEAVGVFLPTFTF